MSAGQTLPGGTVRHEMRRHRSWPVLLLALPAFVAIWSGWVGLGSLTGFGVVRPLPGIWDGARLNTAITLPIGVETYAAYALSIWLSGDTGDLRVVRFAKWSALGSLALGAAGQVAYHLMVAAGMTAAPWQITALVACLPVAVLGMGAALAHLVNATPAGDPAADEDKADRADRADTEKPETGDDDTADRADTEEPETPESPRKPRTARRPRTGTGTATAVKAARLKDRHPDWPNLRIAQALGISERTLRRHLNPPTDTGNTGDDAGTATDPRAQTAPAATSGPAPVSEPPAVGESSDVAA